MQRRVTPERHTRPTPLHLTSLHFGVCVGPPHRCMLRGAAEETAKTVRTTVFWIRRHRCQRRQRKTRKQASHHHRSLVCSFVCLFVGRSLSDFCSGGHVERRATQTRARDTVVSLLFLSRVVLVSSANRANKATEATPAQTAHDHEQEHQDQRATNNRSLSLSHHPRSIS